MLLFAAALGVLAMAIWVVAWRATHDAIRVERFVDRRDEADATTLTAVANALALLETGTPSSDPYEAIDEPMPGKPQKVTIGSGEFEGEWVVEAVPADDEDVATLPTLPASFAGS